MRLARCGGDKAELSEQHPVCLILCHSTQTIHVVEFEYSLHMHSDHTYKQCRHITMRDILHRGID